MNNDPTKPAGSDPGEGKVEPVDVPRRVLPRPPPPRQKPTAGSRSALPGALVGPASRRGSSATPGETGVRVRVPGPPRLPSAAALAPEPVAASEPPISSEDEKTRDAPFARGPIDSDIHDSLGPQDSLPPPSSFPADQSGPHRQIGRCELFAEIAHGGMATVHLGRWIGAGGFVKTVAVKALHAQFARDPEFVRMFLDEAQVVARIRHPNVMPTIDLVEERGELFIVMEFVESVTLSELIKRMRRQRQRVPVNIVMRVMTGVLQGLHSAHDVKDVQGRAMGLIHRDVSPENILVGTDGYARLIDFGIARALGRHSSTREGQVKGKLGYLAPEQVTGDPLDRRTDVFSASVVLWQALTGRKLFRARTIAEVTHKILYATMYPPSRFVPELGTGYDAIVMRGLERTAQKRWNTAEEMAEALEGLGAMASHREVGEWVRATASDRLARITKLVKAVENAPLTDASNEELERPLSIHPAPPPMRAGVPSRLELSSDIISAEDESRTDATQGIVAPRPLPVSPKAILIGAALLVVVSVGVLVVALTTPAAPEPRPPATAEPTATVREPPPTPPATAVPKAEPTVEPSASVGPDASASAAPVLPKGRWPQRDPRLPNDI